MFEASSPGCCPLDIGHITIWSAEIIGELLTPILKPSATCSRRSVSMAAENEPRTDMQFHGLCFIYQVFPRRSLIPNIIFWAEVAARIGDSWRCSSLLGGDTEFSQYRSVW